MSIPTCGPGLTRDAPTNVGYPGPQPTSRARAPGLQPARCTNQSLIGVKYRSVQSNQSDHPPATLSQCFTCCAFTSCALGGSGDTRAQSAFIKLCNVCNVRCGLMPSGRFGWMYLAKNCVASSCVSQISNERQPFGDGPEPWAMKPFAS